MSAFSFRLSSRTVVLACLCMLSACTKSHDVQSSALTLEDGGVIPGLGAAGTDANGSAGTEAQAGTGVNVGGVSGTGAGTGFAGTGFAGTTGAAGTGAAGTGAGCNQCTGSSVMGMTVPPCCTPDNKCGLDLASLGFGGCVEKDAPGNPDANCPPVDITGFITLDGCCRADGTCGSIDTFLGLGCTLNMNDQSIPCNPGPI